MQNNGGRFSLFKVKQHSSRPPSKAAAEIQFIASKNMSHQQDQNPGMDADQSENEVESALRSEEEEQIRLNNPPSFSRQSSIYSLTLNEFQNTLTGSGKNYGSMNMDEFLQSIWTAEENLAQAQNANTPVPASAPMTSVTTVNPQYQFGETSNERGNIARQVNLPRQGSLSVPAPLNQRTVEEVWSELSRTQQSSNSFTHDGSKQNDPTYGEMTLEDFLVKVGVVRDESAAPVQLAPPPYPSPPPPPPLPQLPQLQSPSQPQLQLSYGLYVNRNSRPASGFMVLGCGGAGSVNVPPFKTLSQIGGANVAAFLRGGRSSASACQPANGCGIESFKQTSPVSSDGIGMSKSGRKRLIDGPGERVVERRQKRMIKNRESAARSRAYTIELEAELNQLKDENAYLRQRLTPSFVCHEQEAELATISQQQNSEAAIAKAPATKKDKLGLLRRSFSSPF
ncbi:protein ABSCISIC ACID-INSENSITIVE 5-like isoform X2 [Apium graveolens]|uniref:protein ABSCISIC ACID-INSENSITIVE 5-like isoform X2 n=1 Tax=Apium graveolens TaxID=4045 RepID=UPI003D78D0C9